MNMNNITIRPAYLSDAENLLDIYSPYVLHTAITFDLTPSSPDEFRAKMEQIMQNYPYLIAEQNGEILGYTYASLFVGRDAYNHSAEMSIYIDRKYTHCGIGKLLYKSLEKVLLRQNVYNLYACVAAPIIEDEYLTNNSIDFHLHMGYSLVGTFTRCGRKFDRWYNMVWLEKILASPKNPNDFIPYAYLK